MTSVEDARYIAPNPTAADGWRLERLTAPSRLFGANGLRTGPDGRIYVAQVTGSQISALDLGSGQVDAVSPKGGDIVAPDDVAFDSSGNLYATEVMDGRVSVRDADGRTRVLRDDLPCANGITVHQDRLFVDECRDGGRLMELDRATGAARILLEDLPSPNAMEVGPDGLLYYPRDDGQRDLAHRPRPEQHSEPQRVAGDLGVPDARQVRLAGQHRLDPGGQRPGAAHRSPQRRENPAGAAESGTGQSDVRRRPVVRLELHRRDHRDPGGGETRTVLAGGLNWPLDLAVGDDGNLYVADGTYFYAVGGDGSLQTVGMLFTPGYPGFIRGLAPAGAGAFVVATSGGQIARYRPGDGETDYLADGFDQLYGVAIGPGDTIVFAELGTGRVHSLRSGNADVLASGLQDPVGVAFDSGGRPLVAESGAGRVVRLAGASGSSETVVDGLQRPQGIAVADGTLYIVDAGAKEVVAFDLASGDRHTIAAGLPVGPPPGVEPKPLKGMPPFSGPQGPFAGITVGPRRHALCLGRWRRQRTGALRRKAQADRA